MWFVVAQHRNNAIVSLSFSSASSIIAKIRTGFIKRDKLLLVRFLACTSPLTRLRPKDHLRWRHIGREWKPIRFCSSHFLSLAFASHFSSFQAAFFHSLLYFPIIWALRDLVSIDPRYFHLMRSRLIQSMAVGGIPGLCPDLTAIEPTGIFACVGPLVLLAHFTVCFSLCASSDRLARDPPVSCPSNSQNFALFHWNTFVGPYLLLCPVFTCRTVLTVMFRFPNL